jgi:hypothetical protein
MKRITKWTLESLVMILTGLILYFGIKTVGLEFTVVFAISFLYGKVMLIDVLKKEKNE